MKKLLTLMVAIAIIFAACSSKKTPTDTVKNYLECLQSGKIEKSMDYFVVQKEATPEEKKMFVQKMEYGLNEQGGLKSYELVQNSETISEDGTSATVTAKFTMGNGEVRENQFKLEKVGDEWKIDMKSK